MTINLDQTYNGDGSTSVFAVPFDYDDANSVIVEWSGGTPVYSFLTPGTIKITSPAALAVRSDAENLPRH